MILNPRWVPLLLAAALAVPLAVPGSAAPGLPLVVTADEGMVAVTFAAGGTTAPRGSGPTRAGEKRAVKALNRWFSALLGRGTSGGLSGTRSVQRQAKAVNKVLARLYSRILQRQTARRHPAAPSTNNLSLLAMGALVTAVGLELEEDLTLDLTLEEKSYHAVLDQSVTRSTSGGASLRADYTLVPAKGELAEYLFAALIRESSAPTVGVLALAVVDGELKTILEDDGVTNETVENRSISLPYTFNLTGANSGPHAMAAGDGFDNTYFARENVIGVGVPPALAAEVQNLVGRIPEGD